MDNDAKKVCLECGEKIIGRSDKKFCSDQCRVSFNNKLRSDDNNYIRNVNNVLRKNRRILLELNPGGKTKTTRDKLLQKGFNFTHFIDLYKTKEGTLYYYCYEQGYLPLEDNWVLMVRKNF